MRASVSRNLLLIVVIFIGSNTPMSRRIAEARKTNLSACSLFKIRSEAVEIASSCDQRYRSLQAGSSRYEH